MPEAFLAAAHGDFVFDLDVVDGLIAARWPDRRYIEMEGQLAEVLLGQYQANGPNGEMLLVEVTNPPIALNISCADSRLAATFIADVTAQPAFPRDGSVVLAEWTDDVIALRPHTTPEELLSQLA